MDNRIPKDVSLAYDQNIYGICPEFKEVTLEKREFTIPDTYSGVVPLYAGETINWAIQDVE